MREVAGYGKDSRGQWSLQHRMHHDPDTETAYSSVESQTCDQDKQLGDLL